MTMDMKWVNMCCSEKILAKEAVLEITCITTVWVNVLQDLWRYSDRQGSV